MTHYIVKPINVSIVKPKEVSVEVLPKQQIIFELQHAGSNGKVQPYAGSYIVEPTWDTQTLATKNKYMSNNVTIYSIPYYEQNNIGYIQPETTQTVTKTLSKVVAGDRVLMDLTTDTISEEYLKAGLTAHKSNGQQIVGTATVTYNASTKELIVPSWALEVE